MRILISNAEYAAAEQAAKLRWQLARAAGVGNRRIDKTRSDNDIDLLGICAEIAVSKLLDIPFNASILGIDSGGDLYVEAGKTELIIQVKSTFHENGNLILTNHDELNWDVAVLVTATDDSRMFNVAGCISKDKAIKNMEVRDLGHGPGKFISRDHLSDISKLWSLIARYKYGW